MRNNSPIAADEVVGWPILTGVDLPSEGRREISAEIEGSILQFSVKPKTPANRSTISE